MTVAVIKRKNNLSFIFCTSKAHVYKVQKLGKHISCLRRIFVGAASVAGTPINCNCACCFVCTRRELQSESCECVTCLDRLHFTAGYIFNLEFPRLDSTEGDCRTLHVDILKLPQEWTSIFIIMRAHTSMIQREWKIQFWIDKWMHWW